MKQTCTHQKPTNSWGSKAVGVDSGVYVWVSNGFQAQKSHRLTAFAGWLGYLSRGDLCNKNVIKMAWLQYGWNIIWPTFSSTAMVTLGRNTWRIIPLTLPPIFMEVKKWIPPIVGTFQIQPFSTSMIMGERVVSS